MIRVATTLATGTLRPVQLADRRLDRQLADRVSQPLLVLRVRARLERRRGHVEERQAGPELLVPLLAGRALVSVRERLAGDVRERGRVRPGRRPVRATGE